MSERDKQRAIKHLDKAIKACQEVAFLIDQKIEITVKKKSKKKRTFKRGPYKK